jgi:peptidoglycan-N-acetylglucosamine deacetylase
MPPTPPTGPAPAPPRWPVPPAIAASAGLHALAGAALLLSPAAVPWALGAVLANHLALTAAGLWPRSAWLGPNLRRLPAAARARGEVALTLDDGPDPAVTPAVLDLLAAAGVRATFFVIAERARAQPALLRRIVEAGHDVQNHSLRHRHDFSLRGPRALAAEIGAAQALLADLSGRAPHCFRAPAGLRNPFLDPVLHRAGLHLVSWTRRGFDTRERDPGRVLRRLLGGDGRAGRAGAGDAGAGRAGHRLAAGDILLLHDGHARTGASGRPVVLDVLPPLLAALAAAGLRPVTLRAAVPPRHGDAGPEAVA